MKNFFCDLRRKNTLDKKIAQTPWYHLPPHAQSIQNFSVPEPSCVSLSSNRSKDEPLSFAPYHPIAQTPWYHLPPHAQSIQNFSVPEPSCVSLSSNWSMDKPLSFAPYIVDQQSSEVPSGQSAQQHQTQLDSIFMLLEDNIITFVKNELKKIQKVLSPDYPEYLESQRSSSREAFLKITVTFLRRMKQEELADRLQSKLFAAVCHRNLKSALKKKFECVFEGIAKAGNPTLLNQIYTELYITEGGTAEVKVAHSLGKKTEE
ncbi:uncharacterized protein LOC120723404 [Simochromis diagramma]|uniref:uncharacterized protein LOC120723404 n=1 Tax=Simochromis diagramma TaxID=43689 RepID=UPI001A7E7C26|nr:uncharacterized protein LOC120723404 [Simochromis diagramma]